MNDPLGAAESKPTGDRLDSWKEIASYVGRDVSTVQRWEKREGMPVHRHLHDRLGSVYAFRRELDEWLRSRTAPSGLAPTPPPEPSGEAISAGEHRRRSRVAVWVLVAALLAAVAATAATLTSSDVFWRSPIDGARFVRLTDFDSVQGAAALSRDGRFVAFLSNHDGPTDVWLTQVGSGQFHNLTRGRVADLVNPSVRTITFTPDGNSVTFWVRRDDGSQNGAIGQWSVPTLGGEPRPLLDGAAEMDWSRDASHLVFHTAGPGDPMFVADAGHPSNGQRVFLAPTGEHSHFPLWSPDDRYIYFVRGSFLANQLDIWRMSPTGADPQRITAHQSAVTYPVLLDRRTILYLATDADGAGPSLYGMDVEHRVPHRLTAGPERYTSLSASGDGRRLVATLASPKHSLWSVRSSDAASDVSPPARIVPPTLAGSSPRTAGTSLIYVADGGEGESIWKMSAGTATELWSAAGAHVLDGVAVSRDGSHLAFSAQSHGRSLLYVMRIDGTGVRVAADSLSLQGAPAWSADGSSLIVSAFDPEEPHLFRVSLEGKGVSRLTREYATSPVVAPDGTFVLFAGPEVGPASSVHAVTLTGGAWPLPALTLSRGARRMVAVPGRHTLLVLRGEMQHQNIWEVDLTTGDARQLTHFSPDFDVRDFDLRDADVSSGRLELIVDRVQNQSDIVLLELRRPSWGPDR